MSGKRVLVLDDDDAVRASLIHQLGRAPGGAGHHVETVETIDDARSRLDAESFDVAVLDHRLGSRTTGADFAKEVRARWPSCRVILWTAFADLSMVRDLMPFGVPVLDKDDVGALKSAIAAPPRKPPNGDARGADAPHVPPPAAPAMTERDILRELAEIADKLDAAPKHRFWELVSTAVVAFLIGLGSSYVAFQIQLTRIVATLENLNESIIAVRNDHNNVASRVRAVERLMDRKFPDG